MRCGRSHQRTVWLGESLSVVLPQLIEWSMEFRNEDRFYDVNGDCRHLL